MSATNRGSTRKPHDFYPTPISTIETFLDVFPLRGGIEVLEPGAGSGNIIKTLQKYGDFSIDAVEIRPEEVDEAYAKASAAVEALELKNMLRRKTTRRK